MEDRKYRLSILKPFPQPCTSFRRTAAPTENQVQMHTPVGTNCFLCYHFLSLGLMTPSPSKGDMAIRGRRMLWPLVYAPGVDASLRHGQCMMLREGDKVVLVSENGWKWGLG